LLYKNDFPYSDSTLPVFSYYDPIRPSGAMIVNKLAFVLCQKASGQVVLEKSLEIVFLYKHMWKQFILLWPHPTPGAMIFTNLLLYYVRKFHVNFSFSGPVVLVKKLFNDPTLILNFSDYLLLEEDLALHLNKLEFPLLKDNL
jgi:hypothetical protein